MNSSGGFIFVESDVNELELAEEDAVDCSVVGSVVVLVIGTKRSIIE